MTAARMREIVENLMANDDRTLADVDLADELRAHADWLEAQAELESYKRVLPE